jgi:hypothetical protein
MGDIQTLIKPSNIPPVTLEELNDYSEGNKDKWITGHKTGPSIQYARVFNDNNIYYLASNLVNYTGREEMLGYVRRGLVFLPFYKRIIKTGEPTGIWEDYTTNFEIGGQKKYLFVYDLGPNERAEREAGRSREDEERAMRRAAEDDRRDSRMVQEEIERSLRLMEQMDTQREAEERSREEKRQQAAARLREVETKGESTGLEGVQLKDFPMQSDIGGRRTRRRRNTRRNKSRRSTHRHKSTHRRKLKQSRSSRKLKKSRK